METLTCDRASVAVGVLALGLLKGAHANKRHTVFRMLCRLERKTKRSTLLNLEFQLASNVASAQLYRYPY